ncbi:retrovirus-related pol polyprotein from transposon TNT 1-94 [Tanacetum coccineum]
MQDLVLKGGDIGACKLLGVVVDTQKSVKDFTGQLFGTTFSKFSPTPPREPTPPRDESKGKGIATEEPPKDIMPFIEEGGSEMKRWAELKDQEKKSEEELMKLLNPATIKAQALNYVVNLSKTATIRITRDKDPLNLRVYPNFKLKMIGFSEWLEVHALASKKLGKSYDVLLQSLMAKFQWVLNQEKRLGLPPPLELATFGLTTEEKKRKRLEFIKEVFVTEDARVDGMNRNLIPPLGVVPIDGLVIEEPEYYKGHLHHSSINYSDARTSGKRVDDFWFIQPNNDPLALVSDASVQQYPTQSSKSTQSSKEPSPADNFQLDSGSSSTENLIESLSNTLALLTQSSITFTQLTFNLELRDNVGAQNKRWHDIILTTSRTRCLMQAQESGAVLDEEQSLFLAGEQLDECDGVGGLFDSDVDEGPTSQTMFMANLTSEDPIYDEAGPSYDSNNPFEVQDHDTFVDHMDDNIIPYDQYVEDNEEHVVQCNVSSVRNDALMSILDEMHEHGVQSRLANKARHSSECLKSRFWNYLFKEKDNVIRSLKVLVANVNDRSCEPYNAKDVTALIEQNDCVRIELEKVKQHYKELYDSIKITRAHTSEKTSTMLNEIESLKAQLRSKEPCFTSDYVKPKVLAPGMLSIDEYTILLIASGSKPRKQYKEKIGTPAAKKVIRRNHGMCVVNILNSVNATSTVTTVLNKGKQIWKPKGRLSDNRKKLTLEKLDYGSQWRPTGKKFTLGEMCHLTKLSVKCRTDFGNDHLGAIHGLWRFVMGVSVIHRVYYGTYILKGSRGTNLYMISIDEMMKSSPICLLSKASKSNHGCGMRCLNQFRLRTINDLARNDLHGIKQEVLLRPKSENTNMEVLHTLHMDLCGPMRVQKYKGKIKYILVNVDDYSRFTMGLAQQNSQIHTAQLGTEFVINQVMSEYYEGVGIFHQKSVPRTPQQNGVVERRNRTLVEAARTMMIFSKAPMFLMGRRCSHCVFTVIRSLIITRMIKTPYELVHDKKPDLTFLRVFGALCYPTNDSEDLGKFQAKATLGFSLGPEPLSYDPMDNSNQGSLQPIKNWRCYFNQCLMNTLNNSVNKPVPSAIEINAQVVPPGTSLSTMIAQDAPSTSASSSTSDIHHPVQHQEIAEEPTHEDPPINHDVLHPSHNLDTGEPGSAQSSSGDVNSADHLRRWTKDGPKIISKDGPKIILWITSLAIPLVLYLPKNS